MKTYNLNLYTYDELNDDAKEKAREWYRKGNESFENPFLKDAMEEFITDELKQAGYQVEDIEVFYSLSSCQGDGASFTAKLLKGLEVYEVNRSTSRYMHEYTMSVYHEDENGNETDEEKTLDEMRDIAKRAERYGYKFIEAENSDETTADNIMANEYTFTSAGERMDAPIN